MHFRPTVPLEDNPGIAFVTPNYVPAPGLLHKLNQIKSPVIVAGMMFGCSWIILYLSVAEWWRAVFILIFFVINKTNKAAGSMHARVNM